MPSRPVRAEYCEWLKWQPGCVCGFANLNEAASPHAPLAQSQIVDVMEPVMFAGGVMIRRIDMPVPLNIGGLLVTAFDDRPVSNSFQLIGDTKLDIFTP